MNKETFQYLWENSVEKAANEIFALQPKLIDKYSVRFDKSEKTIKKIRDEYRKNNSLIHNELFYGKDEKLIDYHKIAACFAKAIIDVAPVLFDMKEKPPTFIKIINYMLAFHASVNIVDLLMKYDYLKKDSSLFEKANSREYVLFPGTSVGHDTYAYGRIKGIALNDIYGNDFDLLGFADMLFWIEHYNRQTIENKVFV